MVKKFNPSIHFVLNCGAKVRILKVMFCLFSLIELFLNYISYSKKGCPPISFYKPSNVERGLNLGAINYCTNEIEIDLDKKIIKLPRIFLWYKLDFIYDNENDINENDNHDQLLLK